MQVKTLELQSEKNRKRLVEIVYKAKAGHIGGDLSCLNVLTALYFDIMRVWPDKPKETKRDRFVMSKGHCVEALYVTLEAKGFISHEVTDTLGEFGSILSGHPTIEVPGIEVNSGALGHGLSIGVGMAIAAKMDKADYKTYVLMGDGEQGEGSIYEAAMAGNQYKLDNLVAIIDRNRLQISGTTEEVMSLMPFCDAFHIGNPFALCGMGNKQMRFFICIINGMESPDDIFHLISVHFQYIPAESRPTVAQTLQ